MIKYFFILSATLLLLCTGCHKDTLAPKNPIGKTILMSDGSSYIESGKTYHFYDSGGPVNDYSDNEDYYYTFHAPQGKRVKIVFDRFNTETEYDYMTVNGIKYTGYDSPVSVYSYADSLGYSSLTIYFHSDESVVSSGWSATVTSVY